MVTAIKKCKRPTFGKWVCQWCKRDSVTVSISGPVVEVSAWEGGSVTNIDLSPDDAIAMGAVLIAAGRKLKEKGDA